MHTRLGAEAAEAWRAAAPAAWPSWVVLAAAVVAVVVSDIHEPAPSPAAPFVAADGPPPGTLWALALLTALGLWAWPAAGATIGLALAATHLVVDESFEGQVAFALFGAVCLGLLSFLRRGHAAQLAVLRDVPRTGVPGGGPVLAAGHRRWAARLASGLAAAVVLAAWFGGLWAEAIHEDAGHRQRAVMVTGRVVSLSDDAMAQRVAVVHHAMPDEVAVTTTRELPRGRAVAVRVDPTDPTWAELAFDEKDRSHWLFLAVLCAGAAVGIAMFLSVRRRAACLTGTEGVEVEVRLRRSGEAMLRPVGGGPVFASFDADSPTVAPASRRHRGLDWTPGVAVGLLRHGGWVQVRTAYGAVTPARPVRAEPVLDPGGGSAAGSGAPPRSPRTVAWRGVLLVVWGLLIGSGSALFMPDLVAVARGDGIVGTVTVARVECNKSCTVTGDFRSRDGSFVFRDVLMDADGEVGEDLPAVYLGGGERPDEVYAPGWGGVAGPGLGLVLGLVAVARGTLEVRASLRPPHSPTGRHASPGAGVE